MSPPALDDAMPVGDGNPCAGAVPAAHEPAPSSSAPRRSRSSLERVRAAARDASPVYRVLLFTVLCLGTVLVLPPWIPAMPESGIDPSWAAVLNHAFTHHWQFGKDLVFTFGPFGFLYARTFDPATYGWMLSAWIFFAFALGGGAALVLRNAKPWEALFLGALMFVGFRASVVSPMFFADPVFFLMPLLLGLLVEDTSRIARIAAPALCVLLALASLAKFTFLILAFATILVIEAGRMLGGRRLPVHLLVFAASTLLFLLLGKQDLSGFPDYVFGSFAVASGYSEAMQLFASHALAWIELAVFVAATTAFVVIATIGTWRQARASGKAWTEWLPLSVLVLFLFMSFKAGFVRHDIHPLIAWGGVTAGLALSAAHFGPRLPGSRARGLLLAICALVGAVAVVRNARPPEPLSAFFSWPHGGSLVARAEAIGSLVAGTHVQRLEVERQLALEQVRVGSPLPRLTDSVDVYPWDAAAVLAHGLDYRPRPVFQSFAVVNPRLLHINADHLNSDRAASTVLFGLGTIDARLLTQDEGALWPLLASLYDTEAIDGSYAILRRRASPRGIVWETGLETRATWSQEIPIPPTAGPVWVQIDVPKTLWGRLNDFLYKAPVVNLTLTLKNGDRLTRRLVPTIAGSRFLISPQILTVQEWTEVFGKASGASTGFPATSLRIEPPAPEWLSGFYSGEIRVTFSRLSLDPQP